MFVMIVRNNNNNNCVKYFFSVIVAQYIGYGITRKIGGKIRDPGFRGPRAMAGYGYTGPPPIIPA